MKHRVLAVTLIAFGLLVFLISWDKFVDFCNFIGQPPETRLETYFVIIGQGLLYFTLSLIAVLLGLLLLTKSMGRKLKITRAIFVALLTIWFSLELPIYKCDFYEINHSFWESKKGHFH